MIDSDIGQHYLDHFDDKLNLSEPSDRRIGVQVLIDFFGSTIARIGMEALGFDRTIRGPDVVKQWESVSGKLRSLDDHSAHNEFERVVRELYGLRNETVHNFVHEPDNEILQRARETAEDWRAWFLDEARKYNDSFGAYSTAEYEEMRDHMKDPLYCYDYAYVAIQLEMEIEHAIRNLLKSRGIEPMKYGLRTSVRTAVDEGVLNQSHKEQYRNLKSLTADVRAGRVNSRGSDNFEEVEWDASSDATYQELDDARDAIYEVLELLEHVHDIQSPFNSSRE